MPFTFEELTAAVNPLADEYRRFRVAERLLFTGHSHQAWPDRALAGHLRAWEDAAEDALGRILALQRALEDLVDPAEFERQRGQITGRLQELDQELAPREDDESGDATVTPTDGDPHHALHQALFAAARNLRESWAQANRTTLLEALNRAHQVAKRSGSLRSLVASPKGPGPWLRRLFPVTVGIDVEDYDNRVLAAGPRTLGARALRRAVRTDPLLRATLPRLSFRTLS